MLRLYMYINIVSVFEMFRYVLLQIGVAFMTVGIVWFALAQAFVKDHLIVHQVLSVYFIACGLVTGIIATMYEPLRDRPTEEALEERENLVV